MSRVVSFFWRLILQRKPTTVIVMGKDGCLISGESYTISYSICYFYSIFMDSAAWRFFSSTILA